MPIKTKKKVTSQVNKVFKSTFIETYPCIYFFYNTFRQTSSS